jgi:hypothetical protein
LLLQVEAVEETVDEHSLKVKELGHIVAVAAVLVDY